MSEHQQLCREILEEAWPVITEYAMDRATRAINDHTLEENRTLRLALIENGFNPDRLIAIFR